MERWKRYALSRDGISERVFPGTPNGNHVASSYEHDERGFSTESFVMRTKQVDKRAAKLKAILKEMPLPAVYGPHDAEVTLLGWGSMKLPALDALPLLEKAGIKANFIHFTHLFPLDGRMVKKLLKKSKKLVIVENNSTAQLAGLLRQYAAVKMDATLLKYDGRPFFPEQIAEEVTKLKAAGYKARKPVTVVEKEDLEYYNTQKYGL
jgi:2-oxoglutarate ferredoxin oxidoreductase subunit alpha